MPLKFMRDMDGENAILCEKVRFVQKVPILRKFISYCY